MKNTDVGRKHIDVGRINEKSRIYSALFTALKYWTPDTDTSEEEKTPEKGASVETENPEEKVETENQVFIPSGQHLALIGDRGIGKSLMLNWIAKECRKLNVLTIYASIDPSICVNQLAQRLYYSFSESLQQETHWSAKAMDELKKWKGFGFSRQEETHPSSSIEEFCFLLARTLSVTIDTKAKTEVEAEVETKTQILKTRIWDLFQNKSKDVGNMIRNREIVNGAVLIIDEIDSASNKQLPIGAILKTIIEYLGFHGISNVSLVIAGLPFMRDMIYETHPSTWREFQNFRLQPLPTDESEELARQTLENEWGVIVRDVIKMDSASILENSDMTNLREDVLAEYIRVNAPILPDSDQLNLRKDALGEIVRISDGFPHWIHQLVVCAATHYAIRVILRGKQITSVTLNDLVASKASAFKTIWENYYVSDYRSLCNEAKIFLRLIAIHSHKKVRMDLLRDVSQIPEDLFNKLLTDLVKRQIVEIDPDQGMHEYVSIRSSSYRNWVSQFMHPLLDPIGISRIWNEDECLPIPTTIAGENTTAFESFMRLIDKYVPSDQKISKKIYDSRSELFHSFTERTAVTKFKKAVKSPGFDLIEAEEATRSFSDIWDCADIIAVPHYFLGQASKLGIWTFDELLPNEADKTRKYLEYVIHDYLETSTFRGHWVAVPYSFVAKVLVSRKNINAPETWEQLKNENGEISIHLDSSPNDISLWYEWHQLADNSKWVLFSRDSTDQNPMVLDSLTEAIQNNERKKLTPWFQAIMEFAELVRAVKSKGFGDKNGWSKSDQFLTESTGTNGAEGLNNFEYKSLWVDFAAELNEKSRENSNPKSDLFWYEIPKINEKANSQPLESWVFVIPRKSSSKFHRHNAEKWARFLISTLSMGWQLEFQKKGGCSPINWLARSTGAKNKQPWTDFVAKTIRDNHVITPSNNHSSQTPLHPELRGKSHKELEIMQLEVAFLTSMYFLKNNEEVVPLSTSELSEDKVRARFDSNFPEFIKALEKICKQN